MPNNKNVRRRHQNLFLIFFCIVAGITVMALTQARANVVGSDIQNFNPTTSGIDFVTVQSSETLEPGILNVGFFLNHAFNTMPNYGGPTPGSRTDFTDTMLGGDINFGLGLADNWDFGVSFPQVYQQDTDDDNNVHQSEISQTGLTEIRINTKYRFWGDEQGGFAMVASMNHNRVEDNPFAGIDPGPTYNLEAAWDTTINKYAVGLNAGYRMRDPGSQISGEPIEPYKDQYIASAAVSYLLSNYDTKLIAEVFGSVPAEDQKKTTDRDVSSLELLLGVKKDFRHDFAVHAGFGTELYHGSSSPDWRFYTGVNWNIGPLWRKKAPGEKKYFDAKPTTREKFVIGEVLFDTGSALITDEFREILRELADYLRQPPGFQQLVIEGHTDSVGSEEYNLDLSQRRANAAVEFLVQEMKLPANKIKGIGFGESRPVADNANYQGRARNRRVEFSIGR